MVDVTTAKLSSMHFHGWQLGLKTGMYYLRTKAAADAIKFTVEVDKVKRATSRTGLETPEKGSKPKDTTAPTTPLPATVDAEKQMIERLKAGEPKYACVGCSA